MRNTKGGFVGSNSGSIDNCYSRLGISGRRAGVSGFCGSNAGSIRQSFHSGRISHVENGFGPDGEQENCFYFTGDGEAELANRLPDSKLWRKDASIRNARDAEALGFDPKKWSYTGDKHVLAFNEDSWYCRPGALPPLPADGPLGGAAREKLSIGSVSELESFAGRVNGGDAAARNAEVTLTADLDLGGRSWTPIGIDKQRSFRGSFDGRGHCIRNFRVNDRQLQYRGFFGVLEGGVYNLTVDCAVRGGGVVGPLAGQLLGGTIRCCGAVSSLHPSAKAEAVGGLVGISTGTIVLSYAAGRASFAAFPLLPGAAAAAALLLAAGAVTVFLLTHTPEQPVNRPVETEASQLPIPKADLPDLPSPSPGEAVQHSVSFSTSTEAAASLSTGKVSIVYQSTNPDADHKVIVQLRLSTGVVIAETGAILPGNQITEMTLTDRAKTELTPGRYTAYIYMIPYSVEDESKGFTEINVPITLTVLE